MDIEKSFSTFALVFFYTVVTTGLGLAVLSRVRGLQLSRSASFSYSVGFTLGQALLLIVWLLLAIQGQLRTPQVLTVLSISAVASLWAYISFWKSGRGPTPILSKPTRLLAGGILFLAFIYLIRSFGPFLQGDAVAYYVMIAREAALTGRHGVSWLNYAPFFSFGFEGHFATLFLLGGESAVTLFDGTVAINCLLLVYVLARAIGLSPRAGLFSVLVVLSTGGFEEALGGGKVDIAAAQFGLAAILLCLVALSNATHQIRLVILAGLMAGVCITAKISNALILPIITLAFLATWSNQADHRRKIASLWAVFGTATAVFLIPNFFHSYSLLGEPFLPFLTLFKHDPMPPWASASPKILGMIHVQRTLSNLDIALLPFTWTFFDRPWMGGNISPLYLAVLPLGFLVKWPSQVKLIGAMALTAIAAWLVISPYTLQTRYHFIGLMLLAIVTGHVLDHLLDYRLLRRPILISLLLVGALTLGGARKIRHAIPYITGHETRDQYFQNYSWLKSSWALASEINRRRIGSERAYLTRSSWYSSYFMDDATLRASQQPQEALIPWRLKWNAQAWQYIYQRGFRLIMASKIETQEGELMVAQVKNAPATLALTPVYEDDSTVVYRISSAQTEGIP